jgi:hypothetical protein
MSFPFPTDDVGERIMVRRVPGHPGTLEDMPVSWIEGIAKKSEAKRVSYAVIKGVGSFPTDMLRYDNAVPVNFELDVTDRGVTARLLPGMGDELIVARTGGTFLAWTQARWSSFLWGIREVAVENI